jgi:hypothetical protein
MKAPKGIEGRLTDHYRNSHPDGPESQSGPDPIGITDTFPPIAARAKCTNADSNSARRFMRGNIQRQQNWNPYKAVWFRRVRASVVGDIRDIGGSQRKISH